MPAPLDLDTVYIVCGYRSGSSMMMNCLIEAGMSGVYDPDYHILVNEQSYDKSYIPNPNGYYEINAALYSVDDFYNNFKGKLIKQSMSSLLNLPFGKYYVVMMLRNPEEIEQSALKSFGRTFPIYDIYDLYINSLITKLIERGDFAILTLNYSDVINQPLIEFEKIHMPIDINIAASIINPKLYRNSI